ncbi:low molecular weight protein-tyrosine-phosphatase YwlE [Gottschalkia acidurici 9a]|uniref:Low molecular weight protein-tyrosine-phosphatase YwlE n=2 Tax=Clostridium acidurici TaxID=1556 RepID=K0AXZ2_GOTA9|nr:low molecular weight protein-tyrosine-phosphatase YwlE [Gottschalkia acidurici 9a]
MAEGLFKDMLKSLGKDNEISVSSAGIYAMNNQSASENAIIAMKNKLVDISNHRSKQITMEMIEESDIILTMTNGHKQAILQASPGINSKVFTLKEFVGLDGDIADPFGGSIEIYEESLKDIKIALQRLTQKLIEEER